MGIILVGKISNWFLDYSDATVHVLNIAMFSMIGVVYLAFAWAFDRPILKLILGVCGIYLIFMNFIADYNWKSIVAIICMLTPMIIGRFMPNEADNKEEVLTN